MTRNQKIALGCGGAGCFGLVVLAIVIAGVAFLYADRLKTVEPSRASRSNSNYNKNSNTGDSDDEDNTNSSESTNSSPSKPARTTSSAGELSNDDKHKLFQAASMTGDPDLVHRVSVKIKLLNEDNTPGEGYADFIREHLTWAANNADFVRSINTTEKARAYVDAHIND